MLTVNFDDERLFKVIQDAVRSVILENPTPPSASTDNQKLLTRKEAADLAGVCLATVDNKVKSGVLKKYRTGGVVRFRCPLPLSRNRSKVEILLFQFQFIWGFIPD